MDGRCPQAAGCGEPPERAFRKPIAYQNGFHGEPAPHLEAEELPGTALHGVLADIA
jgi:hypothetical protein